MDRPRTHQTIIQQDTLILESLKLLLSCVIGLTSQTLNCLNADKGIKLMLVPRSQSALPLYLVPMEFGIVKLLGSFNF